MKHHIITVQEYNELAERNWAEYVAKCDTNNLLPQKRSVFNCFMKFPYSHGFVVNGKYPLYYRTKKQALKTLGLA